MSIRDAEEVDGLERLFNSFDKAKLDMAEKISKKLIGKVEDFVFTQITDNEDLFFLILKNVGENLHMRYRNT